MTEMLPHAWDTQGGIKGLPSSPTVPVGMVETHISDKVDWKHFCSSEKKGPTKAILDQNKINIKIDIEELLILEFLSQKTIIKKQLLFYAGLLDIKWLSPPQFNTPYLVITSHPAHPHRYKNIYIKEVKHIPTWKNMCFYWCKSKI